MRACVCVGMYVGMYKPLNFLHFFCLSLISPPSVSTISFPPSKKGRDVLDFPKKSKKKYKHEKRIKEYEEEEMYICFLACVNLSSFVRKTLEKKEKKVQKR